MKNSIYQKITLLGQTLFLIREPWFAMGVFFNDNITLNYFCALTNSNENKFQEKIEIVFSNSESGLGKKKFLKASDKYEFI